MGGDFWGPIRCDGLPGDKEEVLQGVLGGLPSMVDG
jgi:hypothetical protein